MADLSERLNIRRVAVLLSIDVKHVETTIELLDEGATVPFLARYRKEMTGSLDEVQIMEVRDMMAMFRELEKRRAFILETIEGQEKLTDELREQIVKANTILQLEDLYLPYKPKRKSRATTAREKGLEPLALKIIEQGNLDVQLEATKYIDVLKGVADAHDALNGARDIVAEIVSENIEVRDELRKLFRDTALIRSRVIVGKEIDGEKFRDYFNWDEKLMVCPSHRMLAMRRGEKEGVLLLDFAPDINDALQLLEKKFVTGKGDVADQMKSAVSGSYKRLLQPTLETEFREFTKDASDKKAIEVFAQNLRQLLLSPPLGQKTILAVDPGFRTGCKIVVLNEQGKLLEHDVIYPHLGNREAIQAEDTLFRLIAKHQIEAISIGNGTAGRETEEFIRKIPELPKEISVVMVSESGASIYSASAVARDEFPDLDLTVRGAVSIGRRLADPLAELVKLDPKSIGVGQYQHDVDQLLLKKKLDEVVESCVNAVGVELNTASKQLLSYVSGIGSAIAKSIVEHRDANGPFKSRSELKKVARLGDKAYEQAAGFLRIRGAKHLLDQSAVHPESYPIVEQMARDLSCEIDDLIKEKELRTKINPQKYITSVIGLPTLKDILSELEKPGRDPRKSFEVFKFQDGVNCIEDLRDGMRLPGIVTNVTNFGAFVDIGVHQDGLVHISQLSDLFVDDPNKVVKVQQQVMVTVTEVDAARKRIALSMKGEVVYSKNQTKNFIPKIAPSFKQKTGNDWQDQLAALKGKLEG